MLMTGYSIWIAKPLKLFKYIDGTSVHQKKMTYYGTFKLQNVLCDGFGEEEILQALQEVDRDPQVVHLGLGFGTGEELIQEVFASGDGCAKFIDENILIFMAILCVKMSSVTRPLEFQNQLGNGEFSSLISHQLTL